MLPLQPAQSYRKELYGFFKLLGGCADNAAKTQPSQKQQINSVDTETTKQIILRGRCNNKDATFFVDTGSSVTLESKSFNDFLGFKDQIQLTKVKLSSFTANEIKTYGEITLNIELAHCYTAHRMIITDLAKVAAP